MDSLNFLRAPILTRRASSPPYTAGSQGHELYDSSHSRTAKPTRSPGSAAARFTHFGHGPMQLSLSLLHAERAISRALSILEVAGAIIVRRDRASRAAVRELGGAKTT